MNKQKQIKYLQEELSASEYHLWALKKGLYKVHGFNDTPKAWEQKIQALEKELKTIFNERAEETQSKLKEEVQDLLQKIDVVINGNTVQKVEIEPEPEEVETVSELVKIVEGVEITARLEINTNPIKVGRVEYREREIIRFTSSAGNASYDLTLNGWLVTPGEMSKKRKEKIFKVFSSDLDRLGPAPQPDSPQPEIPILQVVDTKELEFWQNYVEKSLSFFKDNGRLRTGWKPGQTCYKHFKRLFDGSFSLGYSERLSFLKRLAGEMYQRKRLRETLIVSQKEIAEGIEMIERFERRES